MSANITQVSLDTLIGLANPARSLSLRRSRIRSRRNDAYRSRFKGRGMEYDESRLYQAGDDVRYLDWRVTARTGKTHTKLFCEERERPVYVWVDGRAPMFFATRGCYKFVVGAKLAALLAWSAGHESDRVGGIVFSDDAHHETKPRRGKNGILPLLHYLADCPAQQRTVDLQTVQESATAALLRLTHIVRPGSLAFLISDFRHLGADIDIALRRLAAHSEVVLVQVYDPLEEALPPPGEYPVSNGESQINLDTGDKVFSASYAQSFKKQQLSLQALASKLGTGFLVCRTCEDPFSVLRQRFGT